MLLCLGLLSRSQMKHLFWLPTPAFPPPYTLLCSYTQLEHGAHKLPLTLLHYDSLHVAPLFSTQPEHPDVATVLGVERTENKHKTKYALWVWINSNMERAKTGEI